MKYRHEWKFKEIKTSYPYTCFSSNSDSNCNFMLKISGKNGDNWPILTPISYSSKNYQATLNNTKDSYIKTTLDNWYKKNLLDNYSKYIADLHLTTIHKKPTISSLPIIIYRLIFSFS